MVNIVNIFLVGDNKNQIEQLIKDLNLDFGLNMRYYYIFKKFNENNCFKLKLYRFEYELCFMKSIYQYDGDSKVLIG